MCILPSLFSGASVPHSSTTFHPDLGTRIRVMYLLHIDSLKLEQFLNKKTQPKYAILSHTWGRPEDEITFQQVGTLAARSKAGYAKIEQCCRRAKEDKYDYVWIDTCCIDKTSSAELSEAISSMFYWYKGAAVCYAYLSDVKELDDRAALSGEPDNGPGMKKTTQGCRFSESRWFTRGWTSQELLAPDNVVFYDRDWIQIGTKKTLYADLSSVTGIPDEVLMKRKSLNEICIAERMSWIAHRETTREEDMAYCLLGIFSVQMPVMYGEGPNAFLRLEQTIMRSSDDHTLFAWVRVPNIPGPEQNVPIQGRPGFTKHVATDLHGTQPSPVDGVDENTVAGAFTSQPKDFRFGHGLRRRQADHKKVLPYSTTNKGLCISLALIPVKGMEDIYLAVLDCELHDGSLVALYLKREPSGQYVRVFSQLIGAIQTAHWTNSLEPCEIYIKGYLQMSAS